MTTTTDMQPADLDDAHGDAIDMECERAHDAFIGLDLDVDDAAFLAAREAAERADRQQVRAFRMWVDEAYVGRDYDEAIVEDAAHRIAALTIADLTDEMIEQAIAWSTEPCPKCGDLILVGCGRHLAKHVEVTA